MVDAEHDEAHTVRSGLAVFAGSARSGEFVRANHMLRAKIARAQAVSTRVDVWHFIHCQRRQALSRRVPFILNRLRQRRANIAAQRIIASQRFVRAFQNNDVFLALQRGHNRGLRERPNHIHVNRTHCHAARRAQIVDRRFNVLRSRTKGDKHRIRIVGLVFADESVAPASQFGKLLIRFFKEL